MKKFVTLAAIAALTLGVSSAVFANVCAFDAAPAATLLFPFVQYEYDAGLAGATTVMSITNVSNEAQIVHVTLWTDFSIPVLDFNILLTGYDTQQLNIRDILADGLLPVSGYCATATASPNDDPVAGGPVSDRNIAGGWDSLFDGYLYDTEGFSALGTACDSGTATCYEPMGDEVITLLRGWLTSSQKGLNYHVGGTSCSTERLRGSWFETRSLADYTWMYITVDTVVDCGLEFPSSVNYWGGANAKATNDNVLIGDMGWVNPGTRFSEMANAVHIEADDEMASVVTDNTLGESTFYNRYSITGIDDREPLPNAWGFRYEGADQGPIASFIRAWKGATTDAIVYDLLLDDADVNPGYMGASDCDAYTFYAWDEHEDVVEGDDPPPFSFPTEQGYEIPNLLPLETQEVAVTQFQTPAETGWMLFVWPPSNDSNDYTADDLMQTWMGVKVTFGDFSAFHEGAVLANYGCFSDQVLPVLGVNYDYVVAP